MNIGFFTNFYLPRTAGIVTLIENYRKELERQGHKVFIFAPKDAGYPKYKDENPRVFRFKSIDLNYKISYPLPIISSPRISRTIKKINLDIAHTQHFFACGQLAWYYAKKFNIPLIFTKHTRYEFYTHYVPYLPEEISKPLAQVLCAFYANSCDAVIAPTQDIKDSLLKYKVKKPIVVLPSGIDLNDFSKTDDQAIRRKYNIGKDKIVLLTVSRLGPEKNISFLLKSFKKIISKHSDVYFMIVGDGSSKKSLEIESTKLGLKEKVIFTGEVSRQKVPSFYDTSDVFLFSSFSEVQPTVITEAMAAGLPIVAIKAYGIKDAVIDGKNGILSSNNINEFSQAVMKLINNQELRKSISEKAKKIAKNYSVENATKKLLNLYEKTRIQKRKKHQSRDNHFVSLGNNLTKSKLNFLNQIFNPK